MNAFRVAVHPTKLLLALAALQQRFSREITESTFRDNRRVIVPEDHVYLVLEFLLRERGFDMLVELTAVDYLAKPDIVAPGVGIESLTAPGSRLYNTLSSFLLPGTVSSGEAKRKRLPDCSIKR